MKKQAAPTKAQTAKNKRTSASEAIGETLRAKGTPLTTVRRDVIEALVSLKEPVGAYQLLDIINKKRAKPLSPMSLYRTLDFFISLNIVLKIDRTNSYALCCGAGGCHHHVMIVCDKCGHLDEVPDDKAFASLKKLAEKRGHSLGNHGIEIHGLCGKCH